MTLVNRELSKSFFIGASVLLFLSCTVFPSSLFLAPGFFVSHYRAFDHESAITTIEPKASAQTQRVPIPFGLRDTLRISSPNGTARLPHGHDKRWDTTWIDTLAEGAKLLAVLRTGTRTDSPFHDMTDLTGDKDLTQEQINAGEGYGWEIDRGGSQTPDGYDEVFDDLHIPNGQKNQYYAAHQNFPFRNCRYQHNLPTDAMYYMLLNERGKTITATSSYSPMYIAKRSYSPHDPPPGWIERLPMVSRHSDVMWIMWKDAAGEQANDLKYIFRHHIISDLTQVIMEMAVGARRGDLEAPWPGHEFKLGSNVFVALLGTPHGRAVVYLLTQHASGLPGKDIESIRMFTTDENGFMTDYHLLFTLTGDGN